MVLGVTDHQALEIAAGLTPSNDSQRTEVRAVARSLKALIPELGESWAIAEVHSIPSNDESQPWLLSLAGEPHTLWTAFVCPAEDPKYEWPKLMVHRHGVLKWGVSTITDAIHYTMERSASFGPGCSGWETSTTPSRRMRWSDYRILRRLSSSAEP
jgi:hypothetical protein